jgi:Holliday junction resolvasome RuvABC endonuclease subunit
MDDERKVIGLDLGTKTGYAFTYSDRPTAELSGFADFSPRRHEGGGMRFLRFRIWLENLIGDSNCVVFYEEVAAHKGTAAAHAYGGFLGVLTELCERRSIPYRGLPVGTIKKHATGKGNAGKSMMLAKASTTFGEVKSEDQADALWVLDLGLRELESGI